MLSIQMLLCQSNIIQIVKDRISDVPPRGIFTRAWPERGKLSVRFTCAAFAIVRFGRKPKTVHPAPFTFPSACGYKDSDFF